VQVARWGSCLIGARDYRELVTRTLIEAQPGSGEGAMEQWGGGCGAGHRWPQHGSCMLAWVFARGARSQWRSWLGLY
jgi:hypothetical protein